MDKKLTKNVKSDFDEILSIIEKAKENEKLSPVARVFPSGKMNKIKFENIAKIV